MHSATRVFAIRHGETAWNVGARIQGHLDIPLNDTGRWQAERLAAVLAEEAIDAVYASDLLRASQTAEAVARAAQAPLVTDAGLRERGFGVFEGLMFADIKARWPDDAQRWSQREPDFAPHGGGESLTVFYARCVGAATRLVAAHPGQTVALVAHGGVMDCLYRAATRVDLRAPRSWQLSNAAINRLLYTPQGFTLVGWNDTGHLALAPRDEPSGDTGPNPIGHSA
ncbi:MAG TPA: histidine phosphatase family protein [Rhizobacter sp.]|nr:histidine phosphatase family protein [Rhizobacter sp.]